LHRRGWMTSRHPMPVKHSRSRGSWARRMLPWCSSTSVPLALGSYYKRLAPCSRSLTRSGPRSHGWRRPPATNWRQRVTSWRRRWWSTWCYAFIARTPRSLWSWCCRGQPRSSKKPPGPVLRKPQESWPSG
jgi:hypothetical protein